MRELAEEATSVLQLDIAPLFDLAVQVGLDLAPGPL